MNKQHEKPPAKTFNAGKCSADCCNNAAILLGIASGKFDAVKVAYDDAAGDYLFITMKKC